MRWGDQYKTSLLFKKALYYLKVSLQLSFNIAKNISRYQENETA